MLYGEIIAVCSQTHTKHINTLRGQNVELLNVKPSSTYSDHWCLKVDRGPPLYTPHICLCPYRPLGRNFSVIYFACVLPLFSLLFHLFLLEPLLLIIS
jgi:hypothetical protein